MRKNEPRNAGFAVTFRLKGELAALTLAKVRAKKCPNPRSSAFWNRKDDRLDARKLICPTTEITAHQSWSAPEKPKSRDRFHRCWKERPLDLLVRGGCLPLSSGQRSRCYFNCHSDSSSLNSQHSKKGTQKFGTVFIKPQFAVFIQAQSGAYWLRLIVRSAGGMSRMVRWPRKKPAQTK